MRHIPKWMIGVSIWGNKVLGNKDGWPICATLWQKRIQGKIGARLLVKIVDAVFFLDPNHCKKSYLMRRR